MSVRTVRFQEAEGGSRLLLVYSPEYRLDYICALLGIGWDGEGKLVKYTLKNLPDDLRGMRSDYREDFSMVAKHVYHFEQGDLVDALEQEEELVFRFASAEEREGVRYWKVGGRVLDIRQDVLLCADRRLKHEMFAVGYDRWTSVFRKISDVLDDSEAEIVIGGDAAGAIPWDDFDGLLARFPTAALLRHYGEQEIADTIGYYLKPRKDYAEAYAESKRRAAAKVPYEVERIGTESIRENFGKSLLESIGLVEEQLSLGGACE